MCAASSFSSFFCGVCVFRLNISCVLSQTIWYLNLPQSAGCPASISLVSCPTSFHLNYSTVQPRSLNIPASITQQSSLSHSAVQPQLLNSPATVTQQSSFNHSTVNHSTVQPLSLSNPVSTTQQYSLSHSTALPQSVLIPVLFRPTSIAVFQRMTL